MQNHTVSQSLKPQAIEAAGHQSRADYAGSYRAPDDTSSEEDVPGRNGQQARRTRSLVRLVQHAYSRLLAGDTKDARRALELALSYQGYGALPDVTDPTMRMQESLSTGPKKEAKAIANPVAETIVDGAPIVVKTLGTFEVLVNGEAAGTKRKPPHLLLNILKVLIANGGCSVNRALLLDALWPDLDGDHANDAQQVALHRLRRLLKHPDALIINHGYVSLNSRLVEVDAFILDSLCRNPFIADHQERASTAMHLYRGTFLPDELESPWSQRMRECMRAKFVNIIAVAGKELESRRDFASAAALYEQALTVDDVENIIHEGLMRALRREKSGKSQRHTTSRSAEVR